MYNLKSRTPSKQKKNSVRDVIRFGVEKVKKVVGKNKYSHNAIELFYTHLIPIFGIKEANFSIDSIDKNMNDFIKQHSKYLDNMLTDYTSEVITQLNKCPCNRR